ncbi:MAG: tRNA (guanosine(46)-N7)-methyltransferase TrmB [Rhodospirillaceae bacterium]|nr:tRNA (guanosine(46)-N7)-methyltransferase TrmB [Rhodospirillaceae bacterium]
MPSSDPSSNIDKSNDKSNGPVRSFGRRRGKKLRPGRERLVNELLPAITFDKERDLADQFGADKKDIWLEIGFGGGEHLARQAIAHPDIGFIGAEPFINGVAKLVSTINDEGIKNIRIHPDDARFIFPAIADGSLGRVFILFPDPWPKARHIKRRLITAKTLDALARMMRSGAQLVVASDHVEYVRWALLQISQHPDFSWMAENAADWRTPPAGWVTTRYEEKALIKGIKATYLVFQR